MIKLITFFVLTALFSVVMAWFADNNGEVSMEWLGYQIDTSVMFLVCVFGAVLVVVSVLISALRKWQTRHEEKRSTLALTELTRGFAALETGDLRMAKHATKRASKLVGHKKNDQPIIHLLEANIFKQEGNQDEATKHYAHLLEHEDTEMVALRGLLQQATEKGNYDEALRLAEKAARIQPDSVAVITLLLGLYKRQGDWEKFDKQLEKVKRSVKRAKLTQNPLDWEHEKALSCYMLAQKSYAREEYALAYDLLEESLKHDMSFMPAAIAACAWYEQAGKDKKIAALIEKIWRKIPQPQLSACYVALGEATTVRQTRRAAKLYKLNGDTLESQMVMARAYLANEEYRSAREYLKDAIARFDGLTVESCELMEEIERKAEHPNEDEIALWQQKRLNAHANPTWYCESCLTEHVTWQVTCHHCGAVDKIHWHETCPSIGKGAEIAFTPKAADETPLDEASNLGGDEGEDGNKEASST